jgi:hypothetical protein
LLIIVEPQSSAAAADHSAGRRRLTGKKLLCRGLRAALQKSLTEERSHTGQICPSLEIVDHPLRGGLQVGPGAEADDEAATGPGIRERDQLVSIAFVLKGCRRSC